MPPNRRPSPCAKFHSRFIALESPRLRRWRRRPKATPTTARIVWNPLTSSSSPPRAIDSLRCHQRDPAMAPRLAGGREGDERHLPSVAKNARFREEVQSFMCGILVGGRLQAIGLDLNASQARKAGLRDSNTRGWEACGYISTLRVEREILLVTKKKIAVSKLSNATAVLQGGRFAHNSRLKRSGTLPALRHCISVKGAFTLPHCLDFQNLQLDDGSICQCHQNVGIPSAVEPQGFVLAEIA